MYLQVVSTLFHKTYAVLNSCNIESTVISWYHIQEGRYHSEFSVCQWCYCVRMLTWNVHCLLKCALSWRCLTWPVVQLMLPQMDLIEPANCVCWWPLWDRVLGMWRCALSFVHTGAALSPWRRQMTGDKPIRAKHFVVFKCRHKQPDHLRLYPCPESKWDPRLYLPSNVSSTGSHRPSTCFPRPPNCSLHCQWHRSWRYGHEENQHGK